MPDTRPALFARLSSRGGATAVGAAVTFALAVTVVTGQQPAPSAGQNHAAEPPAFPQPVLVAGAPDPQLFLSTALLSDQPVVFFSKDFAGRQADLGPVLDTVRTVVFHNDSREELAADLGDRAGRLDTLLSSSHIVHVVDAIKPRLSIAVRGTYEVTAAIRPVLAAVNVPRPTTEVTAGSFRASPQKPAIARADLDIRADDNPMIEIDGGLPVQVRGVAFEYDTDRDGRTDSVSWLSNEPASAIAEIADPALPRDGIKVLPFTIGGDHTVSALTILKEARPDRPFAHFRLRRISILHRAGHADATGTPTVPRVKFFGRESILVPRLIADTTNPKEWLPALTETDGDPDWIAVAQGLTASNERFAQACSAAMSLPPVTLGGRPFSMNTPRDAAAALAATGTRVRLGTVALESGPRSIALTRSPISRSEPSKRVSSAPTQAGCPRFPRSRSIGSRPLLT